MTFDSFATQCYLAAIFDQVCNQKASAVSITNILSWSVELDFLLAFWKDFVCISKWIFQRATIDTKNKLFSCNSCIRNKHDFNQNMFDNLLQTICYTKNTSYHRSLKTTEMARKENSTKLHYTQIMPSLVKWYLLTLKPWQFLTVAQYKLRSFIPCTG